MRTKPLFARLLFLPAVLALTCGGTSSARAQFNAFKDPTASAASSGATSGPDIKAVNEKIDAGKVTVGATAYVVAIFKNNGTSPVNVTGINLYPSSTVSAQVNLNKCSEAPLPPEAQCAITVAIAGLQVGSFRVEVLLDHDGRTRLAEAAMSGTVESSVAPSDQQVRSDIEATPANLDFGAATGGIPLVSSVLLRNRTSEKVNLTDFKLDAPAQSGLAFKSACPPALLPSESCVVNVTWTPNVKGPVQGVLVVGNSAKSGLTKIDIKGAFTPEGVATAPLYPAAVSDMGVLVSDKDKIDFGTGIDSVSAITASLVNMGAADLTLKSLGLSGSDNGLSVARAGCRAGTVLKPGDACPLTVNWVPSRAGSVLDDLQILHTGARGVLLLEIRGTATAAATRESIAVRQNVSVADDEGKKSSGGASAKDVVANAVRETPPALTPVLDGYAVTSHSPTKAVINGPAGGFIVHDGEDVVISGTKWTVTIVSSGVILSTDNDEIMLVFDKSLRPAQKASSSSSSSSSSTPAPSAPGATPAPAPPVSPAAALGVGAGG